MVPPTTNNLNKIPALNIELHAFSEALTVFFLFTRWFLTRAYAAPTYFCYRTESIETLLCLDALVFFLVPKW